MRYITVILLTTSLLYACQHSGEESDSRQAFQQEHPEFSGYSLEYEAVSLPDNLHARLFANPLSGKVLVYLTYTGEKENISIFSPDALSITVSEGGRAHVKEMVPANSTNSNSSFIALFDLVNDRWFYKETGLSGDLCPSYSLEIAPLNQTLNFEIDEAEYNVYLEKYGMEKSATLYDVVIDTAIQRNYQINNGLASFLHADVHELSLAGVNLHLQAYQIGDSLKLAVKLVNHSNYELLIQPDVFIIKSGGQLLQPGTHNTEMVHLRKGDRFIRDFAYFPDQKIAQFVLLKEAIQIIMDENTLNLFAENIRLSEQIHPARNL